MDLLEAMKARHSVRSFTDRKIEGETLDELRRTIDACNQESGLHLQLCLNEPGAFSGLLARYGKFKNANNYLALVGKKDEKFEEACGYYGEKIVLHAQQLGLNSCWVGASFSKGKSAASMGAGEKLCMVIALGYGETEGVAHKAGKSIEELATADGPMPDWFRSGVEATQLAPTAMHQQKFHLELKGDRVKATPGGGFFTKVDLGIIKYHFELGAGDGDWEWLR